MNKKFIVLFSSALLFVAVIISAFTKQNSAVIRANLADTSGLPGFTSAKDHKGSNVINTSGFTTLSSGLDNDYYQLDSINRTGFLYIETKMARFVNESAKKTPLNISIVIDRSGSMAGEKMEFAKKAAKDIIDKLDNNDFVNVVIYDDVVEILQPAVQAIDKASIKVKIDKIMSRGSTNLWGGAERGYEQIKSSYKKDYVNRVLLISDGLANAGLTDTKLIKVKVQQYKDNDGITISTFGVGLDYNEILMTDMAESGNGNYHFIDKVDKMAAIFDKELNGLLNVVAQNAELRITLPRGVTITKVYPFKYELQGSELVIKYRDLFSEETKGVMLNFSLDDYVNTELKFDSRLVYNDIVDGQQKNITNTNLLNPVKNIDAYLTHFNKTVAEQVVLFTANENMEKAMLEADKGNYEAAKGYTDANSFYFKSNKMYVMSSPELQKMDSVNSYYNGDMMRARTMSADSLQYMQKSNRATNYKLRTKKN